MPPDELDAFIREQILRLESGTREPRMLIVATAIVAYEMGRTRTLLADSGESHDFAEQTQKGDEGSAKQQDLADPLGLRVARQNVDQEPDQRDQENEPRDHHAATLGLTGPPGQKGKP
jgi:hypothetical protein